MAAATIEDLADQLTEVSDRFIASFQQTMEAEDEITTFLRGRQRWYVGTQQNQTGSLAQTQAQPEQLAQAAEPTRKRKKKCPKPKNVKTTVTSKVDMGKLAKVGAIATGVALIVGGIALALADGPQPGPADAAALPIIIQGANKIIPFIRTAAPVLLGKGGLVTKPTKALIGEAGPEIVVPMHKLGDAIRDVYKQGSRALLEATAGFLGSQPNNPSKGKLLGELNKLKVAFGLGALKVKGGKFGLRAPIKWWNKGRNERVIDENNASWAELLEDDMAQRGQSDESFAAGEKPPLLGRPDQAFNPFRPAEKGGPGSGPTPAVRQAFERPVRGLMNLGKSGLDAVSGVFKKSDQGEGKRKPIPAPMSTGRDIFGQPIMLNPPTESAWIKAVRAAAADGVDLPGSVTSAYRDSAEQQSLIDNEDDPSVINAAPLGASPHQQGWAVDIDAGSEANSWMRENGNKFGFQWEGKSDPVHFDFKNNEDRGKYLSHENSAWKPENRGGASSIGGQVMNVVGDMLKKKFGGGSVGDPENTELPDINPPEQDASTTSVNETPVTTTTKNGTKIGAVGVPVVIPGVTKVMMPPPRVEKLDPDVLRHIVVDQFNKATRLEVAYV